MAYVNTGTTNFSVLVQDLVQAKAEQELRARLVHANPDAYVPGRFVKGTNQIRFARYSDLGANATVLGEGVPPTSQSMSISSDAFSALQYGQTLSITDLAQLDSPHDLISIASDRLARQAAETMDIVVRDVLAAGTNVRYAPNINATTGVQTANTARGTITATARLTGEQVKKTVASLKAANVPTFADGTYRCIIHPFQEYDLISDTSVNGWLEANKYVDNTPLITGEIGKFAGVRFVVSSNAKVFTGASGGANDANVYSAFFMGPDSYTVGDSQTLQAYFTAPGGDHSDPLAQMAIAGWKMRFGAKILDLAGAKYVRLETGATLGA
jgi:N4-gp56 family major capsid protein